MSKPFSCAVSFLEVGWLMLYGRRPSLCPAAAEEGVPSVFSSKELFLDSFQLPACSSAKETGGYLWQVGGLEPLGRRENPLQSLGLHLPFSVCHQRHAELQLLLLLLPLLHFLSEGKSLHCPSSELPGVFCCSCVAHTCVVPILRPEQHGRHHYSRAVDALPPLSVRRLCPAKAIIV